jgi:hypothetical protein
MGFIRDEARRNFMRTLRLLSAVALCVVMTASIAIALKQDMRRLWTDHVVWTRDCIIAAVGDQPDALSEGIIKQFPDKFGPLPVGTTGR